MHQRQIYNQTKVQGLQAFAFPLMMKIGSLSSKQSVGVKCKEGSALKVTGIFVILLSQDDFESVSSERKS